MKLADLLKAMSDDNADVPGLLAGATPEALDALATAIVEQFQELQQGDLTSESIDRMERLADARDAVRGEVANRDAAAAEATERVAQLAQRINGGDGDGDGGDDGDPEGQGDGDSGGEDDDQRTTGDQQAPTADAPDGEPVAAGDPELVNASARKPVNLAAVKARAGTARLPQRNTGRATIIAAADLPGVPTGATMDMDKLVAAAEARFRGFPSSKRGNGQQFKASIASIERPFGQDVTQSADTDNDSPLLERAVDQSRLPGGSLVAAGGWCAPSETVYDLCEPETVGGLVSIPELAIRRGGLRYPVAPLFSDIYSAVGFQQTEAENIAGEEKDCYEVTCPSFTEVRLDAIGVCITAGILQQRGYPEMVQRVIRGAMTAHAHKVNAYVLGRLEALSTAVTPVLAGFGAWADSLSSIELQVEDIRYKYRLDENAQMEFVAPRWMRAIFRADLAVRAGADPNNPATNAQLDAHFRARGVNPQWVLDWQDAYVDGGAGLGRATPNTAWPTAGRVLMYPAGTFVKGTADIISLDAIYDSTNIRTNSYTALFTEEGALVAKRCMESRVLTLGALCPSGRTGIGVAYDCTP